MPCVFYAPTHPQQTKLISRYGQRPGRTSGKMRHHAGIDIGGGRGTPVYCLAPGQVDHVVPNEGPHYGFGGYGNAVVVRHSLPPWSMFGLDLPARFWVLYAHLHEHGPVREGQAVEGGALVGTIGNTSNGKFAGMVPHLHFEMRLPPSERGFPGREDPFPGPYERFDFDPEPILNQLGIRFGRKGRFEVEGAACLPPYQPIGKV